MNTFLQNFHFLHPVWLLAMLLLPLLLWWLLRQSTGQRRLARVADAELLPLLLAPGRSAQSLSPWLLSIIWLLACLALAGPAWQRLPLPVEQGRNARVIVLSLADSMLATDLKPDRLAHARFKIRDLLEAGRDGQNALVAYAGAAFVVAPLTADSGTVLNLLSSLKPDVMPVPGDRADLGIDKAVQLLQQAGFDRGDVILVADHAGNKAVAAAQRALKQGMHVSVLGVGTDKGTPVALPGGGFLSDDKGNIVIPRLALTQLKKISAAGDGIFRRLQTGNDDVRDLIAASNHAAISKTSASDVARANRWRDEGPWLLLLLVPLAALAFRRGWLMVLALALVVPVSPAQAGVSWSDLWRNRDQQAAQALADNKPEQALKQAKSPGLRGSAAYRGGDYESAAQAFADGKTARAHYNLGNALARQGEYEQAIQAWNKALKMDPDLADARANRKSVEDWLKQQRKQQGQKPGDKKSGKNKKKPGSSGDSGKQGKNSKDGKQQSESGDQNKNKARHDGDKPGQKGKPGDKSTSPDDKGSSAKSQDQAGKKPQQGQQQPPSGASAQTPAAAGSVEPAPALSSEAPPRAMSGAEAKRQQEEKQAAQQALSDALNKQMKQKQGRREPVHKLGTAEHRYDKSLTPAMRQSLERVPDDPGGLLRRKFKLEYQQRQQRGGGS